jgi:hypothetical protein
LGKRFERVDHYHDRMNESLSRQSEGGLSVLWL